MEMKKKIQEQGWFQSLTAFYKGHRKACVYAASAFLPMMIMLVVWFFMGMYPFGNKSLMAVDFGQQYISFYGFLKESLLSGDWSGFLYSFTKSLGGEMTGVVAYYLLSPFNILYIIMPLGHYSLAVFLTIWLRYGVIGLSFAHLLIRRYKGLSGKVWLVPILATAYTLSGMLVSYQMNPIFYDAMIMLPLVILNLEEMLDGGRPYRYILTLALTVFLQFYMGYMICLFVALYACYYMAPKLSEGKNKKERLLNYFRPLFMAFFYSVLGFLATTFLLAPVIVNLLNSKGQVDGGMTFSFALQINPLDILSKLMIGGFDNNSWSAGPSLPNIYVGALALIGAILYFLTKSVHRNRKIGAGIVLLLFFLSFINEFVSKIWHMGQNPAGFFFRFSWIVSFFLVLLAYQALKAATKMPLVGLAVGAVVLTLTGLYVSGQDYTYLAPEQPLAVTEFVKGQPVLVGILLILVLGSLALLIWRRQNMPSKLRLVLVASLLAAIPLVYFLLSKGIFLTQLSLTLMSWGLVLLFVYLQPKAAFWSVLVLMTVAELGYNAYLSQVTLGYADAYKFHDATTSVKRVTDSVQANSDATFYRIGGSFAYSKTVPSLISYPGLATFSSSLERSTMDLFAYMGDAGVNAATQYANGTQLTDALYGVRYYMDRKDYTQEEVDQHPEKMYFGRYSHRFDIPTYYTKTVYEDDRYIVYENPNVFSAAFGTNSVTQSIQFGRNNPVANQNIILNSMAGTDEKYFEAFSFTAVETENVEETVNENGETLYNRVDKNQPAIVRYKIVPKSRYTYYFLLPVYFNQTRNQVSILLNNKWFTNQQTYTQKQLWQLTSNTEGQETVLEFRFTMDEVNMTGAGLIRANNDAIQRVLNERLAQNMKVEEWTNTKVTGTVNITDDSTVMMTSIPYSEGWRVKVDGKEVKTTRAWDSLLSFPITSGEHKIEMTFSPQGATAGALISIVDLLFIFDLWRKDKEKKNSSRKK